jgi:hypothetical protein
MNNDQEQTWPTNEELEKAQTEQNILKKRVPKGTSEYQAAWILSDNEEEEENVFLYFNLFILFLLFIYFRILKIIKKI